MNTNGFSKLRTFIQRTNHFRKLNDRQPLTITDHDDCQALANAIDDEIREANKYWRFDTVEINRKLKDLNRIASELKLIDPKVKFVELGD